MKPFSEWNFQLKGATIIGGLTALVLVADAISAASVVEPYEPATHGFVRALIDIAQAADNDQQKQIADGLRQTTIGILDLKLTALDGQIQTVTTQLNEVMVRLHDAPNDTLLEQLKDTIQNQINDLVRQRGNAACQETRAMSPQAAC